MGDYRSLAVWEKAHSLVLEVYGATSCYAATERYELGAQTRRAAASIPANIAEGCGRNSDRELGRYCRISLGSASELEYHLLLARDLGILPGQRHAELASRLGEVKRMLAGLDSRVSRRQQRGAAPDR